MRAAVTERHRHPFVPLLRVVARRRGQLERRPDRSVVGAQRERRVDPFRDRHCDHAVMRRQAVHASVLDRPVVRNVAVDGVEVDVSRIDAVEDDAAVRCFGRQIAVDVDEVHPFVHRAHFDAPFRLLERDFALHRLQRDETRPAPHLDVAARRFDRHVAADALQRDVGVSTVHVDRHPAGHRDRVVERAWGATAQRPAANAQNLLVLLDVDRLAVRMRHFDADRVPVPHLHVHVAREVVDVELRAFGDLHRLVGRGHRRHRKNEFCKHVLLIPNP